MKRSKKHKVKQETSDTSTSRTSSQKEHDLAYYIHDRVELMHQVFTVLKPKELKAMAPECVRHINISNLQELCMEELLGISSKRLCAILDGGDPPSDTESSSESSPDMLETISLDSISSDDEILSQVSSKKSKKHKHHSKSKKKKSKDNVDNDREQEDRSRRAGLTMLELLELQARARAIRAQLQKEQALALSTGEPIETVIGNTSDDEVEIKEETAEVVEISSEDEKPNVQELEDKVAAAQKENEEGTDNLSKSTKTVTKKVNDLIITVPQTNTSRKIKLKRNNNSNTKVIDEIVEKDKNATATSHTPVVVESSKRGNKNNVTEKATSTLEAIKPAVVSKNNKSCSSRIIETTVKDLSIDTKDKDKNKDKKKKKQKNKKKDEEGSDHDEITLQLSDTEKLDLLEGLEGKTFEMSSDAENFSKDSDSEDEKVSKSSKKDSVKNKENSTITISSTKSTETKESTETHKVIEKVKPMGVNLIYDLEKTDSNTKVFENDIDTNNVTLEKQHFSNVETGTEENSGAFILDENNTEPTKTNNANEVTDIPLEVCDIDKPRDIDENTQIVENVEEHKKTNAQEIQRNEIAAEGENNTEISTKILQAKTTDLLQSKGAHAQIDTEVAIKSYYGSTSNTVNIIGKEAAIEININKDVKDGGEQVFKESLNEKSEGELSDRDSSEVEESELQTVVLCISDDEDKRHTKKKKEKKCKKRKKSKKSKDFRNNADQNFYTESINEEKHTATGELILTPEVSKDNKHESVVDCENNISTDINNTDNLKQTVTDLADKSDIVSNTAFDDDVDEILELSDDSSCYEVEEISISEEPTTEEIKALSAKIDELERARFIDVDEVRRDRVADRKEVQDADDLAGVSWKDRYLESAKVKEVLSTANILNAMRKKNLDLKKKLQESKIKSKTNKQEDIEAQIDRNDLIEGSIQHYNTLEASTKYVDPVKEPAISENVSTGVNKDINEGQNDVSLAIDKGNITDKKDKAVKDTVTKEMKKEAKQLLKMYKMLLKYNDVTKQPDTTKKKKKKKKSKDKDMSVAS